jgi:lipopolysaccharide transport system permease protein
MTGVIAPLITHRNLVYQLTLRDVMTRYRGSMLGILWAVLQPVLLLFIYTFVFTQIFQARWMNVPGTPDAGSEVGFALILFMGMIVHGFFAECLTRAPALVTGNANYVKKVVFPLEILPWVALNSVMFHTLINCAVFLLFLVIFGATVHPTIIALPIVFIPLILVTIGCMWLVAAVGVYIRDITYVVTFVVSLLMFLSPVFYPLAAVPEKFRGLLHLNPLTFFIEQARDVALWGKWPDWIGLGIWLVIGAVFAYLALRWFEHARKGFADVL